VAANLVTNAITAVAKFVTRSSWERADELGRLFYLLEGAFGDELESLTHTELDSTWRTDTNFMEVYERLSATADHRAERRALVKAIEPLVGPTAKETPRQVAQRIAEVLPFLMAVAKEGSERVLFEMRRMENLNRPGELGGSIS